MPHAWPVCRSETDDRCSHPQERVKQLVHRLVLNDAFPDLRRIAGPVSALPAHSRASGRGRLTGPTAVAQPGAQELVFMPLSGRCLVPRCINRQIREEVTD